MIDYLLIGHITADITTQGLKLGGTVSYAAPTAQAFGLKVGVITKAAQNEPLLNHLAPYASLKTNPSRATTTFENLYTPQGRTQFIRAWAEPITENDLSSVWMSAPLVHLAPVADEVNPALARWFPQAVVLLTLQGCLRRWDADGRVRFKRWFDTAALDSIDLVVFSEEDILEAPELEHEFANAVRHLVVTRGEKGGTYYHAGQAITYDTPQVEAKNLTGAGDVFAAALLAAQQAYKGNFQQAIPVAAALAAASVTRQGLASAPTVDEVQRILAQHLFNNF